VVFADQSGNSTSTRRDSTSSGVFDGGMGNAGVGRYGATPALASQLAVQALNGG